MATDVKKHTVPGANDRPQRAAFDDMSLSIRDFIPVADVTERSQLVADLTAAGKAPSLAEPVFVFRQDGAPRRQMEYSTDGSVWVTVRGELEFSSVAAANAYATANPGYLIAGDTARVGFTVLQWSGSQWRVRDALAVGLDKGVTSCPSGGWRPLNTSVGTGTNVRNDGFTYGAGSIGVPYEGLYEVAVTITFPNAAVGSLRGVHVVGATVGSGIGLVEHLQRASVSAGELNMSVAGIIPVTSALVVEAVHDSGANRDVAVRHFSARYLGPIS